LIFYQGFIYLILLPPWGGGEYDRKGIWGKKMKKVEIKEEEKKY
jgi:hypothetical protein